MKYKLLLISLGFMHWSFAEIAEQVQQARKNQLSQFNEQMIYLSRCGGEVNDLSSKVSIFRNTFQTKICQDVVDIDKLKKCVDFQKTAVDQIKYLIQSVMDVRSRCSVFNAQNLLNQLYKLHKNMEEDLLDVESGYKWIVTQAAIQKKIFNKTNYSQCHLQTHGKLGHIVSLQLLVSLAQLNGDVYGFQKGLSALHVLNSYIKTKANMCKQRLGNPQDSRSQINLDLMEKTVQKSQEILNATLEQAQNINVNEWMQRHCEVLHRHIDHIEICENPINTPSWLYTIHHIFDKTFSD